MKIVNAGASVEEGGSVLLPKKARKNSSLEEDGINALCPLIGQCVAESLSRGIDSREKIDL